MKVEVKTNHHWRDFIYGYELTPEQRKEFDYLDEEELIDRNFISYKGHIYDSHEFLITEGIGHDLVELRRWHAYRDDSFFSGVVIRLSTDCEQYQIGTYMC